MDDDPRELQYPFWREAKMGIKDRGQIRIKNKGEEDDCNRPPPPKYGISIAVTMTGLHDRPYINSNRGLFTNPSWSI